MQVESNSSFLFNTIDSHMRINFSIVLSFIAVVLALYAIYELSVQQRTGYVDIEVVFDSFSMKKELQKKYISEIQPEQQSIDSLRQLIVYLEQEYNNKPTAELGNKIQTAFNAFQEREERFKKRSEDLKFKYDEQVQKRLKQYLIEFAEGENMSLLFSTMQGNTVIYGRESFDYTQQAIVFANENYLGNE